MPTRLSSAQSMCQEGVLYIFLSQWAAHENSSQPLAGLKVDPLAVMQAFQEHAKYFKNKYFSPLPQAGCSSQLTVGLGGEVGTDQWLTVTSTRKSRDVSAIPSELLLLRSWVSSLCSGYPEARPYVKSCSIPSLSHGISLLWHFCF